jgi:hypothetical protein
LRIDFFVEELAEVTAHSYYPPGLAVQCQSPPGLTV